MHNSFRKEFYDKVPGPLVIPGFGRCVSKGPILIAETFNLTPHLETGLEIAIRLAADGYQVDYLYIGHHLPQVFGWHHQRCLGIKNKLLGYTRPPELRGRLIAEQLSLELDLPLRFLSAPQLSNIPAPPFDLHRIEDQSSLKKIAWRGDSSMGISILSSLISLTGNPNVIPNCHPQLLNQLASSYAIAHELARNLLANSQYEALIVYNGRLAPVRGLVTAANHHDIPVFFHERGATKDRFSLNEFQMHDNVRLQREIIRSWTSQSDQASAVNKAIQFFKNQSQGIDGAWLSFTSHQKSDGTASSLVEHVRKKSKSGKVLIYFSSADDEYACLDGTFHYTQYEWINQRSALIALIKVVMSLGHQLIVRVHPHLDKKDTKDRLAWNKLEFVPAPLMDFVTVVPSYSPLSTYELMNISDAVVTYGSTIGIEAVFAGKPSILLMDSIYDSIGATLSQPRSSTQLESVLKSLDDLKSDPSSALPYGFFMGSHGIDYQLYSPIDLFRGSFMGQELWRYCVTKRHRFLYSLKSWVSDLVSWPHY